MAVDSIKRSDIVGGTTREFLTSYDWNFNFTKVPEIFSTAASVERLLNETLLYRTDSVTVPEDPVAERVQVVIHGHSFSQPGLVPNYGTFGFQVQDFADAQIQAFFTRFAYLTCDPLTKAMKGYANQFKFNCKITQLDSQRNPIKVWNCKDCLVSTANVNDILDGTKTIVGGIAIVFTSDCYTIEYFNGSDASTYDGTNSLDEL